MCKISLQKIGDNIIGFYITSRNFIRYYSIASIIDSLKETETDEEFISRKTTEFLDEIKDYRDVYHLMEI